MPVPALYWKKVATILFFLWLFVVSLSGFVCWVFLFLHPAGNFISPWVSAPLALLTLGLAVWAFGKLLPS